MKRLNFSVWVIFTLALFIPALVQAQTTSTGITGTNRSTSNRTSSGSSSSSNTTASRLQDYKASVDEYAVRVTVRSMLETYAKNHPNIQVRIWSLIVLSKFGSTIGSTDSGTTSSSTTTSSRRTTSSNTSSSDDDTSGDFEFYLSLPTLFQMLDDKEEVVRLIASQTLQSSIDLSEEEWQRFMAPILINIAKTAKNPDVRIRCIKFISKLSKLNLSELNSLPLLLDMAQNEDKEVRQSAMESLDEYLKQTQAPPPQAMEPGLTNEPIPAPPTPAY
ncbi:MAG TPA: HEAT repeat domain-containing protein [bacterium]|nr:HEAT repeat domain-containing protein [bacterium]HNS48609.1 HEAT repeat domain-containing protein [bacterium]